MRFPSQSLVLMLLISSLTISSLAYADSLVDCIQAANRTRPCPHQIFRAMYVPALEQMAARCICVTDFLPLLEEPQDARQRLAQLRLRQQFKAELGYDVEHILKTIRRDN